MRFVIFRLAELFECQNHSLKNMFSDLSLGILITKFDICFSTSLRVRVILIKFEDDSDSDVIF